MILMHNNEKWECILATPKNNENWRMYIGSYATKNTIKHSFTSNLLASKLLYMHCTIQKKSN